MAVPEQCQLNCSIKQFLFRAVATRSLVLFAVYEHFI